MGRNQIRIFVVKTHQIIVWIKLIVQIFTQGSAVHRTHNLHNISSGVECIQRKADVCSESAGSAIQIIPHSVLLVNMYLLLLTVLQCFNYR